ncbi:MAG: bifunctional DNA primase/polymerase [Nitrospiraceae bacterium]|nr:bifunctional DNA primase/polymerase [Nitrospiraceae bacterium]
MNQLQAALMYSQKMKYSVIPVGRDKKPLIKWEAYQKQRANEQEIRAWAKQWPDMNIGIVTGVVSGLAVIDVDDAEQADPILDTLLPDSVPIPSAQTPSGGKHYYFTITDDKLSNNARLIPGADLRANGGYVVAPPSVGANGKPYAWMQGLSIDEVMPSPLPAAYLQALKPACINKNVLIREGCKDAYINDSLSFKQGTRDNDIFHVANCLVKGGMSDAEILQVLEKIALSCEPPFPTDELEAKILSAIKRQEHREINLTKEVEQWVFLTDGDFSLTDVYTHLQNITGLTKPYKNAVQQIFHRLKSRGVVRKIGSKNGVYRRIDTDDCPDMDIENVSTEAHPLQLPLRLRELVKVMPKNIIVVAGAKSAGKTAFLMNTAYLNRNYKEGVYYYNSEMGPEELRIRIDEFETPLSEWKKIRFKERTSNFADVIKLNPDSIHIIDFLEMHDDFFRVAQYIREVYDALGKGIAVIAIQKNAGQDYGLGGARSIEKARLYLSLDYGKIKITDAKIFARKSVNPRGLELEYKLAGGCKYVEVGDWLTPGEGRR